MSGPYEQVFKNARLVLADEVIEGAVQVQSGRIIDISPGASAAAGEDLEGDYLLPGLVELHTDHFEKHLSPRPGVDWPAFSALKAHDAQLAGAGITTVFDAVAIGDSYDKPERSALLAKGLAAIAAARKEDALRAEHFVHIRCEVAHPNLMTQFEIHGASADVRLVSLMDHTPGTRQFTDVNRSCEIIMTVYGLTREEAERRIADARGNSARFGPGHRAAIAEHAQGRGITIATHDDATVEHVDEAVALGATISEFPTTLEAAQAAREAGLATIMGAPNVVRGGSHSGNVAAVDLARAGLLDALSSDYMPVSLMEAPFLLTREADMALPAAVRLVTRNPAHMVGLADRGEIAEGLRADFVRVRTVMGSPVVQGVWRQARRVA